MQVLNQLEQKNVSGAFSIWWGPGRDGGTRIRDLLPDWVRNDKNEDGYYENPFYPFS